MDCAIFCLLLALCAFQAVFADDSAKVDDKSSNDSGPQRPETESKLTAATNKLQNNYYKTTEALKPKGSEELNIAMLQGRCLNESDNPDGGKYLENYITATVQCNKCYNTADQTKDTKAANKCCNKAIKAFLKSQKPIMEKATACVKKCLDNNNYKSEARCKKMLMS